MKKQILSILILVVAIVLFNSCEKEEFTPTTEETTLTTSELESTAALAETIPGTDVKIEFEQATNDAQIQTRSEFSEEIYKYTGQVHQNQQVRFFMDRNYMRAEYEYSVILNTPGSSADLYIYGYQENRLYKYRDIRQGQNRGINPNDRSVLMSEVTLADLITGETHVVFAVQGIRTSQFTIQIFRRLKTPPAPRDTATGEYLFFYDWVQGLGRVYQVNPNGKLHQNVHATQNLRPKADIVIKLTPSPALGGLQYILTYKRDQGLGEIYKVNSDRTIGLRVATYNNWRTTWDKIVQVTVDGKAYLVFYDNATGNSEFWELLANGTLGNRTASYTNWYLSWTQIVPVTVDGNEYLLFYDYTTGISQFWQVRADGKLGNRTSSFNWDKRIDNLVPITTGDGNEYLLSSNREQRTIIIHEVKANGSLGSVRTLNRNFNPAWDFINPIRINGVDKLAFYDGGLGGTIRTLGYYNISSNGVLSSTAQVSTFQLSDCNAMFPIY
ncbi:MAG: hypothetical protein ACK4TA_21705 [Saprospiraceae bacterium]